MIPTAADDGTGYIIVSVPHSVSAPHGVRHLAPETHWVCYPLRHGTTTIYLSEAQIAARYRSRFELARSQVDRLGRLHESAPRERSTATALLAFGIVPAIPGYRPLYGDGPKIADYFDAVWHPRNSRIAPTAGRYQIKRGRLQSIGTALVVDLHSDGSAWAQMPVGSAPGQDVNIIVLEELERTAVELATMLGGYTCWAGAAGDCAVGAWLYDGPGRIGIQLPGDISWVGLPRAGAETTGPVEQLAGDSTQVGQVVYPLIRDLLQDMGIAEPSALRADGTMAFG
jgi:hypothetical protein